VKINMNQKANRSTKYAYTYNVPKASHPRLPLNAKKILIYMFFTTIPWGVGLFQTCYGLEVHSPRIVDLEESVCKISATDVSRVLRRPLPFGYHVMFWCCRADGIQNKYQEKQII
jgi:hypothetical protein